MTEHFDALMDMGRFEGGHFQPHTSRFGLKQFAASIDGEIAPLCAAKGLAWHLDMADLLNNGVRYTESDEVSCSAKAINNLVEFVASDTGCGIAAEHQESGIRNQESGIRNQYSMSLYA
jgi:K+-sensing histidine kinase KdpD